MRSLLALVAAFLVVVAIVAASFGFVGESESSFRRINGTAAVPTGAPSRSDPPRPDAGPAEAPSPRPLATPPPTNRDDCRGEPLPTATFDDTVERLRNRTIVLVGDCRVKYLYLALAHFLTYASWPDDDSPFTDERRAPTWRSFFEITNAGLNVRGSREECDCYRPEEGEDPEWWRNTFESRRFERGSTRLVYVQFFVPQGRFVRYVRPVAPGVRPVDGDYAEYEDVWSLLRASGPLGTLVTSGGWANLDASVETAAFENSFVANSPLGGGEARRPAPYVPNPPLAANVPLVDRRCASYGTTDDDRWDALHLKSRANAESAAYVLRAIL